MRAGQSSASLNKGMPIKVPPDAKVIADTRLTVIRAVKTLNDKTVNGNGGMVEKVKESMQKKGGAAVVFAESEFVIARLDPEGEKTTIDAHQAFIRCVAKKIGLKKFFECCSVSSEKIQELLSGEEIKQITTVEKTKRSLTTEFKSGFEIDGEGLIGSLGSQLITQLNNSLKTGKAA